MSKVPDDILALPLSERGQIALRVAVGKAIVEHALLGVPIYIGRDGKLVKLSGLCLLRNLGAGPPLCFHPPHPAHKLCSPREALQEISRHLY